MFEWLWSTREMESINDNVPPIDLGKREDVPRTLRPIPKPSSTAGAVQRLSRDSAERLLDQIENGEIEATESLLEEIEVVLNDGKVEEEKEKDKVKKEETKKRKPRAPRKSKKEKEAEKEEKEEDEEKEKEKEKEVHSLPFPRRTARSHSLGTPSVIEINIESIGQCNVEKSKHESIHYGNRVLSSLGIGLDDADRIAYLTELYRQGFRVVGNIEVKKEKKTRKQSAKNKKISEEKEKEKEKEKKEPVKKRKRNVQESVDEPNVVVVADTDVDVDVDVEMEDAGVVAVKAPSAKKARKTNAPRKKKEEEEEEKEKEKEKDTCKCLRFLEGREEYDTTKAAHGPTIAISDAIRRRAYHLDFFVDDDKIGVRGLIFNDPIVLK